MGRAVFHDTRPIAAQKIDWMVMQQFLKPFHLMPQISATKARVPEKAITLAATDLIFNFEDAANPGTESDVREIMRAALLTGS